MHSIDTRLILIRVRATYVNRIEFRFRILNNSGYYVILDQKYIVLRLFTERGLREIRFMIFRFFRFNLGINLER